MVAAKRDSPLVIPEYRHIFRAFVRRAFDGHGNNVGKTLRPFFTRPQLRRLATDNRFSLRCPPSALTVHQWARLFHFMILMTPRTRRPAPRRHTKGENWRSAVEWVTGGEPDDPFIRHARVHQAATLPGPPQAGRAAAPDREARARTRSQADAHLRPGGLRQDHPAR